MRMEEIFDRSDLQTLLSKATSSSRNKVCTWNEVLYRCRKSHDDESYPPHAYAPCTTGMVGSGHQPYRKTDLQILEGTAEDGSKSVRSRVANLIFPSPNLPAMTLLSMSNIS